MAESLSALEPLALRWIWIAERVRGHEQRRPVPCRRGTARRTDASALVGRFGETPDGHRAAAYTLQNQNIRVRITDYGGRMVSVEAPDRAAAGTIMFCS